MGQQEVSESTNTTLVNTSFVTKIASGMSKIKTSVHHIISSITNPNSDHQLDDHDSNLGHNDHYDLEAARGSSSVNRLKGSPANSITTAFSSPTTHTHLSSQNSTPSRSQDSPKPSCESCGCQTQTTLSNPMAQAFRQLELGKSFLTFIMPIATIMLAGPNNCSFPQPVLYSTLCLICVALVALFYGNSLRNMFPKTSNALEQLGTACIYSSFFMAVGSHLPLRLVWFPLVCFLACILMSVWSCLPVKKKSVHDV